MAQAVCFRLAVFVYILLVRPKIIRPLHDCKVELGMHLHHLFVQVNPFDAGPAAAILDQIVDHGLQIRLELIILLVVGPEDSHNRCTVLAQVLEAALVDLLTIET